MNKKILLYLFLISAFSCFAQNEAQLLEKSLKTAKQDSDYVISLNNLCRQFIGNNKLLRADSVALISLSVSEKLKFKSGIAVALNLLGAIKQMQAQYGPSLDYLFRALKMAEEINDKDRVSKINNGIASVYFYQNNNQKALEYYFKTLKLEEETNNKVGIARAYSNIGIVYDNMGDSAKKKNVITSDNKFYPVALEYYIKSLSISEALDEKKGIEIALGNIGGLYLDIYQYDKALDCLQKSLVLSQKLGDKEAVSVKLYNISSLIAEKADSLRSTSQKNAEYKKAIAYLQRSVALSHEINDRRGAMLCYQSFSKLYSAVNNDLEALINYKQYIALRDSLFNEENTKKTVQLEMTYEFDKKEAAAKLEQEKKEALAMAESKKQRIIILSICGILLIVIAFAIFAYRSFLQKQKANLEILKQKQIIEEKQKEILDSIHYAKRIQAALLPSEKYIDRNLKQ